MTNKWIIKSLTEEQEKSKGTVNQSDTRATVSAAWYH